MFKKFLLIFLSLNVLFLSIFTPFAKAQTTCDEVGEPCCITPSGPRCDANSGLVCNTITNTCQTQAGSAGTWYFPNFDEWAERVHNTQNPDEIFGERYTQAQVVWVLYSLVYLILAGLGNQNVVVCVLQHASSLTDLTTYCEPILEELMNTQNQGGNGASLISPPNLTGRYLASIAKRLNIITEVQAQGFGFETALTPIQRLWVLVRNLTYFLLVLVTVVLAFMVMFRVKISPQTVITVQSAIPRIIIALILITFSYLIAGLLIDLMYVVIGLIATILANSGLVTGADAQFSTMFANLTTQNVMWLMFRYFLTFILIALLAIFSNALGVISLFVGVPTAILTSTWGPVLVVFLISIIVILVTLLILSFRTWFTLLKAFVNILLLTIIAPIQILLGVFGFGGFGAWMRKFIANLAVFPTVGVMFFLAFLFLASAIPDSISNALPALGRLLPFNPDPRVFGNSSWVPPLAWGTRDLDLLWLVVSVVIISLIPKTADIIKAMIEQRPFAYGAAIGEALAPPVGFYQTTRGAMRAASLGAIYSQMTSTPEPGQPGSLWQRLGERLRTTEGGPRQEALQAFIERLKKS